MKTKQKGKKKKKKWGGALILMDYAQLNTSIIMCEQPLQPVSTSIIYTFVNQVIIIICLPK